MIAFPGKHNRSECQSRLKGLTAARIRRKAEAARYASGSRICDATVLHLPAGRIGAPLRFLALRATGARVAWPLHIDPNVWIRRPHNFSAGPGTVISRGAVLTCAATLRLGA